MSNKNVNFYKSVKPARVCDDWKLGLGMHWFRAAERSGDSKSRSFRDVNLKVCRGLLPQMKTTSTSSWSSGIHSDRQNCCVKKSNKRYVRNQFFKIGSANIFDDLVTLAVSDQNPGKKSGKSKHQKRKRRSDGTLKTEPFKVFHGLRIPIALRVLPRCNVMLLNEWVKCGKSRERLSAWWYPYTVEYAKKQSAKISPEDRYCNQCMRRRYRGSDTYNCRNCTRHKDYFSCSSCGDFKWYEFPKYTACPTHGKPKGSIMDTFSLNYLKSSDVVERSKRPATKYGNSSRYPFVKTESSVKTSKTLQALESSMARYTDVLAHPESQKSWDLDFARMKVSNLKFEIEEEKQVISRTGCMDYYTEIYQSDGSFKRVFFKDMTGPG